MQPSSICWSTQELIVAARSRKRHAGAQLDQLDSSIASLRRKSHADFFQQFGRLLQKSPLAIVPVVNGV
jgi:hypothetical protein